MYMEHEPSVDLRRVTDAELQKEIERRKAHAEECVKTLDANLNEIIRLRAEGKIRCIKQVTGKDGTPLYLVTVQKD